LLSISVVPRIELLSQLQGPGPTIRALERLAVWLLQVCNFSANVFGGEVRGERGAYLSRLRQVRKCFQQSNQHPVSMHRRMPVVTTVESRMQDLWTADLTRIVDDMLGLIRKLSTHALQ